MKKILLSVTALALTSCNLSQSGIDNTIAISSISPETRNAITLGWTSPPSSVSAGAFVIGTQYMITAVGTTNFVAIGAASNTVGVYFFATGAGSGTGTATSYSLPVANLTVSLNYTIPSSFFNATHLYSFEVMASRNSNVEGWNIIYSSTPFTISNSGTPSFSFSIDGDLAPGEDPLNLASYSIPPFSLQFGIVDSTTGGMVASSPDLSYQ